MGTGIAPKSFAPPQAFGTTSATGGSNVLQQAQAAPPIPQASFTPLNQPAQPAPAAQPDQSVQPDSYSQDPITQAILQARYGGYGSSYGRMQELSY